MLKLSLTRASDPAHIRVKESPLSSDAIFRQDCERDIAEVGDDALYEVKYESSIKLYRALVHTTQDNQKKSSEE
ncbi:hypothetical protein C5167_044117 [Papaver somniferum]|uniref:Uncharacterized protein n=1 Tax=Papaver somniferum TaxID=3469 RepID=A0A4Y7LBH8_PAPSO|nr:hypothetical protein C5167_044117 [Papaver somniferum]